MRLLLLSCVLLCSTLFFGNTALSQDIDATAPASVPTAITPPTTLGADQPAIASEPEMTHREMTRDLVVRAIQESDVGPVRKRIYSAIMRRPIPSQMVTDRVTAVAIERGAIAIPPPTAWSTSDFDLDDDIQAAMDWDEIFEIIKELLPLLLKILSFF